MVNRFAGSGKVCKRILTLNLPDRAGRYTIGDMNSFVFQNKTKIIFGSGTENRAGEETRAYADRVLLHYGSGSVVKSGLLDRVRASLDQAGVGYCLLGGVQPNPRVDLVRQGIDLCRQEHLKFVLAVGGGSVIDSAKAIAAGVPYSGDVWDFFAYTATPRLALDVGVVLTIPAAGSEASPSTVITNPDGALKRGLTAEVLRPVFAIMNPELTFSLPPWQTACGSADIMAHIMERYFSHTRDVFFTDRLCEATLETIIAQVPKVLANPRDLAARSEIMWAGCVAHNDLLGTGRDQAWGCHEMEHEISALNDVAHGAGLAIVFPAWMREVCQTDLPRFAQYANRVWKVELDPFDLEGTALEGIRRLESFFRFMGLPVRLSEIGLGEEQIQIMADKCTRGGTSKVGGFAPLDRDGVVRVYRRALK